MNLLLDIVSPIPEFSVIDDNKIIYSSKIIQSKEEKLSDSIIPAYKEIENTLDFKTKLKSLLVTIGPGSYTSLRVGISFMLGLHFSKGIKVAGLSSEDFLKFEIDKNNQLNCGIYFISSNNQKFICYKKFDSSFKYIKLEDNNFNQFEELNDIDIIYYNHEPLECSLLNLKQKKYLIKEKIVNNFDKIKFNDNDLIKPIYISNNKILN